MRKHMTIYTVHKWLAVTVGAFFLVWLMSGIVMVLPPLFTPSMSQQASVLLDLQKTAVSPSDAVMELAKTGGELPQVRSVTLKQVADIAVYEIVTASGEVYLVHAQLGQPFTITPDIAEQIARGYVASQPRVLQRDLVTKHSLTYQWGPLPAYRFIFDDDRSMVYYVSIHDGAVWQDNRWSWIKGAIVSLHTFEPLRLITKQSAIKQGLLVLLSVIGVGAAITGYCLAWPRRVQSKAL
jgi:hypothetical protein